MLEFDIYLEEVNEDERKLYFVKWKLGKLGSFSSGILRTPAPRGA